MCVYSDITYSILFEAVTTLLVLLSYQLFHEDIIRDSLIYQHIMKGKWWVCVFACENLCVCVVVCNQMGATA